MPSHYSYHHRRHRRTISFPPDTKLHDTATMYGPPLPATPPFGIRRHPHPAAPWHHAPGYYSPTRSRTPSLQDTRSAHHAAAVHSPAPSPLPLACPYTASPRAHDLPSRIAALNRRAATVSAQLAHLTAVARPLEATAPQRLSDTQLCDLHHEGVGLVRALGMLEAQAAQVLEMLAALLGGRRAGAEDVGWMWEGAWERGVRVGRAGWKGGDV